MVVILLVFPFLVTTTTVVLAMLLGGALDRQGRQRHEGSELLDTNY